VFFDKEAERERDICRDAICLKEEAEKGETVILRYDIS